MAKNKKSGCGIFILIMVVLILLGGAGIFVFESYKKQQEEIAKEINELPAFDQATAEKKIAEQLNLQLPVKTPTKTEAEIKEQAEKELKELSKKKVLSSILSIKTRSIIKNYRPAKEGDPVSFLLMTTGKTIRGTFKGAGADHKGKYIKVDLNKYRLYDIDEDQLYLFDAVLSQKRASSEIAGLKREFQEKRQKVIDKNREKILEKIYLKSGYRQVDGEWKPNTVAFQEMLDKKEKEHKNSIKKDILAIYENNKLFAIIDVKLPEDESGTTEITTEEEVPEK